MLGNAAAVVRHSEHRAVALAGQGHVDMVGLAVDDGVLHQVHQYLLHQQGIHGHHHQLIRQMDTDIHLRVVLVGLGHGGLDDLLRRLRLFLDLSLLRAYACDGQQILYNADEPLGVLVGGSQQLLALLLRQSAVLLQQNVGGAHDTGQRRADVVRHGAQQVGIHLFAVGLPAHLLGLLGPAGNGSGQDGDGHHHQERQRKARQRKADMPEGVGKDDVHAEHPHHCHDDAQQIAVRPVGGKEHIQQKDHGNVAGVVVHIEAAQQQTAHNGYQVESQCFQHIHAGKAQANGPQQLSPAGLFTGHSRPPLLLMTLL